MRAAQPLQTNSSSAGERRRESNEPPGRAGAAPQKKERATACEDHRPLEEYLPADARLFQVLAHQLGHREHVDRGLAAEHSLERSVRVDLALVLLVLEPVLLDVAPELLRDLG